MNYILNKQSALMVFITIIIYNTQKCKYKQIIENQDLYNRDLENTIIKENSKNIILHDLIDNLRVSEADFIKQTKYEIKHIQDILIEKQLIVQNLKNDIEKKSLIINELSIKIQTLNNSNITLNKKNIELYDIIDNLEKKNAELKDKNDILNSIYLAESIF